MCLRCKAIEPIHRTIASPVPIEKGADGICQIEEHHTLDFLFIGWAIVDRTDAHAVYFNIRTALCDDLTADCCTIVIVVGNLQVLLLVAIARFFFVELVVLVA